MLKIQEHLRKHGLAETSKRFRLNVKDLGHKIMLKYSQLDSPKQYKEVHESRGIIFEPDKWNVVSYPLDRFFSHNDFYAPKLDWSKTVVMEKRDGSLIQIYYDIVREAFVCNTMFSECYELLYNKGEKSDKNFNSLIKELLEEYGSSFDKFKKGYTYIFELTGPYNKVVVKYDKPELRLIACRNIKNMMECNFTELCKIANEVKIPIVETFKFSSLKECLDSFDGKSFNFEGYVAWDGVGRIKIKNPAYVAVHLASSTENAILDLTNPSIFLDIIKQNEIDEFISSFPYTKEIITEMNDRYHEILSSLNKAASQVENPKNITRYQQKKFADDVLKALQDNNLDKTFSAAFFLLRDGKIDTLREFVINYDNKKLYKLLKIVVCPSES